MRTYATLHRLLLTAIATLITTPAFAQVIDFRHIEEEEGPQEALPTPQAIIDAHIEATGGREAHERIHNRKLVGTFSQNARGNLTPLTIYSAESNRRYVELGRGGGVVRFVTNERESWTYDEDTVVASSGDQKQQEIRRAAFHPLLEWDQSYELAKTIGVEDVEGRRAYKVRLTAEDCHKLHLYFDTETGRHVRTVQEIAYAGDTIQTDTTVGEYREFDGVMLPVSSERILLYRGNRTMQYYEYQSVEHNIDLPADMFASPPELAPPGEVG